MTVVAGIAKRGRCWLLADTEARVGDGKMGSAVPKVRRYGGYVYGCAGDGRACDVAVRWALPRWDGTDPSEWAIMQLVPVIRQRMKDCEERGADIDWLLGLGGALLFIDSAQGVTVWEHGYGAIGSGGDVALGALAARPDLPPIRRLKLAVAVAGRHVGSVGGMGRVVSA
jgi:ATP-dependent protease HslVU (ClpYQ) peptidase subunit